jgi:DNA invertase Pin-like site-specific DNA recombinase
MSKKANITVIPATIAIHATQNFSPANKRRVAAYARVSTDSEEQGTSFTAQVDYYTNYITERPEWQLVSVYTDEGISAVNTKKREGFKRMIADALAGKIDLIVTKSVSRFARNTVDSLNTIRQLKEHSVECFFEKEAIWTFDGKGELLITIMSSLAQEESRSISQNVTWGQRKRFADGKVTLPYKRFLGYEKGADDRPKIVESEAKIVREMYQMYLRGMTIRQIAKSLTEQRIPTPSGKEVWSVSTVKSILTNEKYKGEALLQKTFCEDFLTKKMVKNEGQVPQYYVEESHPAIVSVEIFEMVQREIERNSKSGTGRSNTSYFSNKVMCGACGEYFSPKTWHSTDKYKRRVWQCNGKYRERGTPICKAPHLSEEQLQWAFVDAFNQIAADRERYINALTPVVEMLSATADIDSEAEILGERCAGLYSKMEALVADNANRSQDQAGYQRQYDDLNSRYESVKSRLAELESERQSRLIRKKNILQFIDIIRQRESLLEGFDEPLWRATVESVTVHSHEDIRVKFRDGREITVNTKRG